MLSSEYGTGDDENVCTANGNVNVPDDYDENPSLGRWCSKQRLRWRRKLSDEGHGTSTVGNSGTNEKGKLTSESPMTDEQEGKLLALGFQF